MGALHADILHSRWRIAANQASGVILVDGNVLSPDEARLIGVRLIEAAALADGDRAIRELGK